MRRPLSPADNKITDAGARALAAGIRANKKNGGKLTTIEFEGNRKMTDDGMKAMAEAMHAAEVEANHFTPAAVKDELAALRARDNAETVDLSGATTEITTELGKKEFKERVFSHKQRM